MPNVMQASRRDTNKFMLKRYTLLYYIVDVFAHTFEICVNVNISKTYNFQITWFKLPCPLCVGFNVFIVEVLRTVDFYYEFCF